MGDKTSIEWTDATWNPIVGCKVISPGCTNCYAMKVAGARLDGNPKAAHYTGTTQKSKAGAVWTGKLAFGPEHILRAPLRWQKPRRIFVNSMGDLFHEDCPDEWIDRVFAVMALCPQHAFQVLTKRAERMRAYCSNPGTPRRIYELVCDMALEARGVVLEMPDVKAPAALSGRRVLLDQWPIPNIWKGVSAEDQQRAVERVPLLRMTPAARRFVSAEPLLDSLDLTNLVVAEGISIDALQSYISHYIGDGHWEHSPSHLPAIDWVIVGGESGPSARPMHPDWARGLRDQCRRAEVPFFFKQWGEWAPHQKGMPESTPNTFVEAVFGKSTRLMTRLGKHRTGRLLDGLEHNGMPPIGRNG